MEPSRREVLKIAAAGGAALALGAAPAPTPAAVGREVLVLRHESGINLLSLVIDPAENFNLPGGRVWGFADGTGYLITFTQTASSPDPSHLHVAARGKEPVRQIGLFVNGGGHQVVFFPGEHRKGYGSGVYRLVKIDLFFSENPTAHMTLVRENGF